MNTEPLRLMSFTGLLALLLLGWMSPLGAQTHGLHTEPASPRAGLGFRLELVAPTCHVFWDEGDELAREVSVDGDIITVTVQYTAPPPGSGGCGGQTAREVGWIIGPFPAGDYSVLLVGNDPISGSDGEGIDEAAVTILSAAALHPSVVPAGNWAGWLALGGFLLAAGLWMQRRFLYVHSQMPRKLMLGIALALGAASVHAGEMHAFGLHTQPAVPRAGQSFTLSLNAPTCQLFWSDGPLDRSVNLAGSTVTVTVEYTPPAFNMGCDPATSRDVAWTIGPFPEGTYTLEFLGADPTASGFIRQIETMPLEVAAPAVLPGPAVIPASGIVGLLGLVAALLALSLRRLRSAS